MSKGDAKQYRMPDECWALVSLSPLPLGPEVDRGQIGYGITSLRGTYACRVGLSANAWPQENALVRGKDNGWVGCILSEAHFGAEEGRHYRREFCPNGKQNAHPRMAYTMAAV